MCEILGTGPCVGLLPARHKEKDQTATKRVENFRVPCLDASSTLATSTNKFASPLAGLFVGGVGVGYATYTPPPLLQKANTKRPADNVFYFHEVNETFLKIFKQFYLF